MKLKHRLIVFLIGCLIVVSSACKPDQDTSLLPIFAALYLLRQTGDCATRIQFPGVGQYGIFDPAPAQKPGEKRIWLNYSAVDPSPTWPSQNDHSVSTRLAYSDSQGCNWSDTGTTLNPLIDVTLPLPPPNDAGTWVNEVARLVYDPAAADGKYWKLLWLRYLLIDGDRRFEHSWIGFKAAATPIELDVAPEVKLFVGSVYDTSNDNPVGPTSPPVAGAPKIQLDTALHADLNSCLAFSEPGLLVTGSGFYVSLLCGGGDFVFIIKCVGCNTAAAFENVANWSYLGTAFTKADAVALGYTNFSAPELIETTAGDYYLMVTPVASTPRAGYYSGCWGYRLDDIDAATTVAAPASPDLVISGLTDTFHGACGYHSATIKSGILLSQLEENETDLFRIQATGRNF